MDVHFCLFAFVPFFILLGVVLSAGTVIALVNVLAREKPERRAPLRSAEIFAFPGGMAP